MIDKPVIIIASAGRTGTRFFYKYFEKVFSDCVSYHAPDTFLSRDFSEIMHKVKNFGLLNVTIKKARGHWGIKSLSDKRVSNLIDIENTVFNLRKQRENFILNHEEELYVESNHAFYGLIDILPHVFQKHKLVYIIRDGREWVRSNINWGRMYNKKGILEKIYPDWISPMHMIDDPYKDKWKSMSTFEKICWSWVKINKYAINSLDRNPMARLFKYEDLFQDDGRNIIELTNWVSEFPDKKFKHEVREYDFKKKINKNRSYSFPSWQDWSINQKNIFMEICGEFMLEMNYIID